MKNPDNFGKNTIERYITDENSPPQSYQIDHIIKMVFISNRKAIEDHLQNIFDYVMKDAKSLEYLHDGVVFNFHKGFRQYDVVDSIGECDKPGYLCIDVLIWNLLNTEHTFFDHIKVSLARHTNFENTPYENDGD